MKKYLLFLLMLFSCFSLFSQPGWRDKEMEVRVFLPDLQAIQKLYALHLDGDVYTLPEGRYAVVYAVPSELEKIRLLGLNYHILKEDLNAYYKDFWLNRDAYHSYQQIIDLADSLSDNFPGICHKYLLGTSVQGRQLAALKISDNVLTDENEAEVYFDGGTHGDEIGGAENIIRFALDLCQAYTVDPYITNLINNREIWLYLMANPDGRANMTRDNANGVDLNRNWGYMWDASCGTSSPYSQIETKAMRNCLYDNQFVVYTSYHSGSEFLAFSWSYRSDPCPDYDPINHLASIYSSTSGYSSLPYSQGYTGMYPINGSSKDAAYGIMGAVSWSIEISFDKQPPPSQIMMYYTYNKPAMLAMIEQAGYGLEGTVTDLTTGEPIAAIVLVSDFYPVYIDPQAGDYHKYVLPGTFSIKVMANGYESQAIDNIVVTSENSTVTDFALQPATGKYIYRLIACQIPNNNFHDEGNTPAMLGQPDNVYYSIGKNGWLIADMQYPVPDGPGDDFIIHEGDASAEGYTCYAGQTMDGPWTLVGEGSGTSGFDLMNTGMVEAQYLKVVDDGDGTSSSPDAGFDLDAIESIGQISGVYLALIDHYITDETGNNNGHIDPGETVELHITLRNNGDAAAENITGTLTTNATFISVSGLPADFGNLSQGQTAEAVFLITASDLTPSGYLFNTDLAATANNGSYINSYQMTFIVGQILENWETGDFSAYDWQQGGNTPWLITQNNPFQGLYCAQSGSINDFQMSVLTLTLDILTNGDISFYRKVSSEADYDYLEFYIDNIFMDRWSGEKDWAMVTYPVSDGTHTFKWQYLKDVTTSSGSDCGWIDLIMFPPLTPDHLGVVKGLVTNVTTGIPVEGASVGGAMITGTDGNYLLDLIQGTYTICVTHPEYDTLCMEAVIYENDTTEVNYELMPTSGFSETKEQWPDIIVRPNPFNAATAFIVTLQDAGKISLEIFDSRGKMIKTLYNGTLANGSHTFIWQGDDSHYHLLPDRLYIYKLVTDKVTRTGKLILSR
ncbi:MAG: M14 family zinc carboxypeptidase [Bacteroidetes bacterium]|nr:M14 family zinc carboxypeptidase [Bacteroidota bacterium]